MNLPDTWVSRHMYGERGHSIIYTSKANIRVPNSVENDPAAKWDLDVSLWNY